MFSYYVTSVGDESGIDPRVIAYYDPNAVFSEQFRGIQTQLNSFNGGKSIRSILISSANSGEGKSVTAANLAVIISEDKGQKVLLLDANLRNPSVEKLLNVKNEKGLSDYLSNNIALEQVLTKTPIENLTVLNAGIARTQPAEIFTSLKCRELFAKLKERYNYIIVDASAVIPFADAKILSEYVDGVLLVVQACRSRREVVWRAEELLKSSRTKLLGAILTNVEYYIPEYIHRHL
ncbi:MAG: CpsD/CapB family tyrosine-protein kinase [Candidatus Omnitrophica bacterium]|nr:CpsD/CapB family tyrosine-protein kinase [Candidatus Omnitrophota bacterium]